MIRILAGLNLFGTHTPELVGRGPIAGWKHNNAISLKQLITVQKTKCSRANCDFVRFLFGLHFIDPIGFQCPGLPHSMCIYIYIGWWFGTFVFFHVLGITRTEVGIPPTSLGCHFWCLIRFLNCSQAPSRAWTFQAF